MKSLKICLHPAEIINSYKLKRLPLKLCLFELLTQLDCFLRRKTMNPGSIAPNATRLQVVTVFSRKKVFLEYLECQTLFHQSENDCFQTLWAPKNLKTNEE